MNAQDRLRLHVPASYLAREIESMDRDRTARAVRVVFADACSDGSRVRWFYRRRVIVLRCVWYTWIGYVDESKVYGSSVHLADVCDAIDEQVDREQREAVRRGIDYVYPPRRL